MENPRGEILFLKKRKIGACPKCIINEYISRRGGKESEKC